MHDLFTPARALEILLQSLNRDALLGAQTLPAHLACGRVLAAPARARLAAPPADVSTRDGVALRAADAAHASQQSPARLVMNRDCRPVHTGQDIPAHADAVAMNEDLEFEAGAGAVLLHSPPQPGDFVRPAGEDASPGRLVLPAGVAIRPWDAAGLLSAGVFEVQVYEPVRAVFIPTGDEVLPFADRPTPGPGQVVESSSQAFLAMAQNLGVQAQSVPPVRDNPEAIRAAVQAALDRGAHAVVVGAGSSAGGRDHSRAVFASMGRILVPGLAMVPGRTGVLAESDGRLLACAPGPPPGAAAFCEEVLAPALAWLGRREPPARETVQARLAQDVRSRPGWLRLVRVQLGRVGEAFAARPLPREAGMIAGLCQTQAVLRIPAESGGYGAGDLQTVELAAPRAEIERVLLLAGRHHPALDKLAENLMFLDEPLRLLHQPMDDQRALDALDRGLVLAACVGPGHGRPAIPLAPDLGLCAAPAARNDPRAIKLQQCAQAAAARSGATPQELP
ncbi:MAG: molybdopterin-binding protein [Desulfovibrionaceae bacterium]